METRIYGIDTDHIYDSQELVRIIENELTDDQFIEIAEEQGLVWSKEGFTSAFYHGKTQRASVIRIITPDTGRDQKLMVDVMFYIDDENNKKVYDEEGMREEFEHKLSNLIKS